MLPCITSSDKLYPQCVELQWVGRDEPGERSFHMNAEMTEAMEQRLSDSVCQDTDEEGGERRPVLEGSKTMPIASCGGWTTGDGAWFHIS